MSKPKVVVVIPTVRPQQYSSFIGAWQGLFEKHEVTLVTIWDGESPKVDIYDYKKGTNPTKPEKCKYEDHKSLIYRYTDACRNLGFIVAAHLKPDYVLTLDDDVTPVPIQSVMSLGPTSITNDPIQDHLDVLQRKAPLSWMNTAHDTELYLRGVPYGIRDEAPVMLSHGVWVGTPDFDGETQLNLEGTARLQEGKGSGVPYSLPYYVGPIPKGVLFPLCGMNVMVRAEALPYLYFAPMGVDTKIGRGINNPNGTTQEFSLNRFADIWMGVALKREFDRLGWACYTGGSTILHTRASDAKKNFEQEKLGREWNESIGSWIDNPMSVPPHSPHKHYFMTYAAKRIEYQQLIENILSSSKE